MILRYAFHRAFQELVEDGFLNQSARRAGADLALVKSEQSEAFQSLIEELVVCVHHVREEDVRGFAAQLQGLRNDRFRGVLHDEPAGCGFASEADFRNARVGGQGFADFATGSGDHVDYAGGHQIRDQLHQH